MLANLSLSLLADSGLGNGFDPRFSSALTALAPGSAATVAEKEQATRIVRLALSVEADPPIDAVLQGGLAPSLVESLRAFDNPQLQFEAAWALTNICSGTSDHVEALVACGAVPALVDLLPRPACESATLGSDTGTSSEAERPDIEEQAIWALANIAGDSASCRDQVLATRGLAALVHLLKGHDAGLPISLQQTAVWALSNLCRGKPLPAAATIRPALPCLADLLTSSDNQTVADACWALSFLMDGGSPERVREVIVAGGTHTCVVGTALQAAHLRLDVARLSHGRIGSSSPFPDALDIEVLARVSAHIVEGQVAPRLAALLCHDATDVKSAALAAIVNITAGIKTHSTIVVDCIGWGGLCRLLANRNVHVKMHTCTVVSHTVTAANAQLQSAIDYGMVMDLVKLILREDTRPATSCAAARALVSVVTHATDDQIVRHFVREGKPQPGHLCFAMLSVRYAQEDREQDVDTDVAGLREALVAVSRILKSVVKQRSKDSDAEATIPIGLLATPRDSDGTLLPTACMQVESDELFAVAESLAEKLTANEYDLDEEVIRRAEQVLEADFLVASSVHVSPAPALEADASGDGRCGTEA